MVHLDFHKFKHNLSAQQAIVLCRWSTFCCSAISVRSNAKLRHVSSLPVSDVKEQLGALSNLAMQGLPEAQID